MARLRRDVQKVYPRANDDPECSRQIVRGLWIASLIKRRASTRPALASNVRFAVGRPATIGVVHAGICGTRSTREEFARRASTSGLQP